MEVTKKEITEEDVRQAVALASREILEEQRKEVIRRAHKYLKETLGKIETDVKSAE